MNIPVIRTDNDPQFISNKFANTFKFLGIKYERIPVKTSNMNTHIESFHSILKKKCYGINEFSSFMEVYDIVTNYTKYYNRRKRHESLNFITSNQYYEAATSNSMNAKSFVA